MTEKLLKGGPLQTPLNGGQEAVARAQMRRLQMADSWRDGKVAGNDQPGGWVIRRFPPGTLSSVWLWARGALKARRSFGGSKPAKQVPSERSAHANPGAFQISTRHVLPITGVCR